MFSPSFFNLLWKLMTTSINSSFVFVKRYNFVRIPNIGPKSSSQYYHNLYFSLNWFPSISSHLDWRPYPISFYIAPYGYSFSLFILIGHVKSPLFFIPDVFTLSASCLWLNGEYLHGYCWYGCAFFLYFLLLFVMVYFLLSLLVFIWLLFNIPCIRSHKSGISWTLEKNSK